MRSRVAPKIGAHHLHQFFQSGYLVLPDFLPAELVCRLESEVDRWVDSGLRQLSISSCVEPEKHGPPPLMEIEMQAHGELAGHPPLLELLAQLMGPVFAFHHMHSDRRAPGAGGKNWHHDYEQSPQTDRARIMIHALHYLGGLDASMGGLAVLPGSHREVAEKTARHHLGTAELPGEVLIDRLPGGSTVVLHSALFHTRRPAGAGPGGQRYMVDSSYCQGGVRWRPVKPHWRHLLARARELGLDAGRWPELFDDRHFTEYTAPA
ncbi:MAG TPA: phytanoyl-CoA dioxygenase family protein [Streptomyces sp.]|nr:phytanoyl-CoA dioxygenase family protein [Streptomyces sp.]